MSLASLSGLNISDEDIAGYYSFREDFGWLRPDLKHGRCEADLLRVVAEMFVASYGTDSFPKPSLALKAGRKPLILDDPSSEIPPESLSPRGVLHWLKHLIADGRLSDATLPGYYRLQAIAMNRDSHGDAITEILADLDVPTGYPSGCILALCLAYYRDKCENQADIGFDIEPALWEAVAGEPSTLLKRILWMGKVVQQHDQRRNDPRAMAPLICELYSSKSVAVIRYNSANDQPWKLIEPDPERDGYKWRDDPEGRYRT